MDANIVPVLGVNNINAVCENQDGNENFGRKLEILTASELFV